MNKRIVFAFAILALSLSSAACRPEVIEEDGARVAYVRLYLPARTALVLRRQG